MDFSDLDHLKHRLDTLRPLPPVERRLAYYEALDRAHVDGDYAAFIGLVVVCVREGFLPYWRALGMAE